MFILELLLGNVFIVLVCFRFMYGLVCFLDLGLVLEKTQGELNFVFFVDLENFYKFILVDDYDFYAFNLCFFIDFNLFLF